MCILYDVRNKIRSQEIMDRAQQRKAWFSKARSQLPAYKRLRGPAQPPLSLEDAEKIYNAAGVPDSYAPYKSKVVQYMTEYSQTLDPTERVPVTELIEQAGSVCGKELQQNVTQIKPQFTEEQVYVSLYGLSMALVNGYKQQYDSHFEVDPKTNEIIDLIHPHQQRQPKCDEYLKQKRQERTSRRFAATGEPSDPYRGSQQGLGKGRRRKTKKISKKSKKTLRRK